MSIHFFKFDKKVIKHQVPWKIFCALVENSKQTFFVGGTARDILLKKQFCDYDIATSLDSTQVKKFLQKYFTILKFKESGFGVASFEDKNYRIDIASFRKEVYSGSRFPKIEFTKSVQQDSKRRDFSINSLYLQPFSQIVIDHNNGLDDLKNKKIKFIGNVKNKIEEDPLRILRAFRLSWQLDFSIDKHDEKVMLQNISLLKKISRKKIINEIEKIKK